MFVKPFLAIKVEEMNFESCKDFCNMSGKRKGLPKPGEVSQMRSHGLQRILPNKNKI